jgi:hypothetical protein
LVGGAVMALASLVRSLPHVTAAGGAAKPALSLFFGAGAVVVLPVVYGVLGLFVGFLTALVYNVVARVVGGVEVETEQKE